MNDHDRDNLDFLMSLDTQDAWDNWAEHCSDDDFLYALELIRFAKSETEIKMMEVLEAEADLDCSESLEFINRVKKGVSK